MKQVINGLSFTPFIYFFPFLFRFDKQKSRSWIKIFNQKLEDLVASGRYDHKKDFSVVIQPSLMHGSLPMKNGIPDLDFLAPDCFHWGQRTHALGKKEILLFVFKKK